MSQQNPIGDPLEEPRSYRGQSIEARRTDRRRRFLAAGLEVIGTQGYREGTVSAICAEAKLSRRQFYEQFESREDLLIALYDLIHSQARAAVLEAFGAGPMDEGVEARARPGVAAFFESVVADPRRMRVAFIEAAGISPRVEQHRLETRQRWIDFFSSAAALFADDFTESDFGFQYEAAAFIGALTEAGHLWASSTTRPSQEAVVEMLVRVITALAIARQRPS